MFAVTGITGQVGTRVAETLLEAGEPVRAVVRSADKGAAWAARGCEVAVVRDAEDEDALAAALAAASGVFLMNPPNYDPEPGFPDTHRIADAYAGALARARPGCVVVLSSVGAQVERFNLLNNAGILERALSGTPAPCAHLRPAWFIENAAGDIAGARSGRIESFLRPLERGIDMVSVRDVGRIAAGLLRDTWQGTRVVELRGPGPVRPADVAAGFAAALGHSVGIDVIPREAWEPRFRRQGMRHPEARIAMLDGFNEGWLDFARGDAEQQVGTTDIASVLSALVASA